jgi:hypothetical protein
MRVLSLILGVSLLIAGCSDSPSSPGGTLPVVQNCRIDTENCKGDTITVAWDPVSVEVDGYRVWYADTNPGNWEIVAQVEGTSTQHIATRTGYYCVDAIKALDSSEDQSNKADDRAEMYLVDDTMSVYGNSGIQFFETHTALGDASQDSFAQDLYIEWAGDTILFYSGNHDPENYPGGTASMIATANNYLAPGPGDAAWKNSAAAIEGSSYFVMLENGYYAVFSVDTVFDNWVVINSSQYQPIFGVRLFNPFIY